MAVWQRLYLGLPPYIAATRKKHKAEFDVRALEVELRSLNSFKTYHSSLLSTDDLRLFLWR